MRAILGWLRYITRDRGKGRDRGRVSSTSGHFNRPWTSISSREDADRIPRLVTTFYTPAFYCFFFLYPLFLSFYFSLFLIRCIFHHLCHLPISFRWFNFIRWLILVWIRRIQRADIDEKKKDSFEFPEILDTLRPIGENSPLDQTVIRWGKRSNDRVSSFRPIENWAATWYYIANVGRFKLDWLDNWEGEGRTMVACENGAHEISLSQILDLDHPLWFHF